MLFLVAIAMIYAATGTLNLAQLAMRLPEIDPGVALVLQVLLLLAFAIKAAVFPLSAWLPDSYPTAPAPVTAVFAGLLTKVGVYAIIRTQTLLFPDGRLDDALMWAALATMVIGILGAVAQDDIKRLLSFTWSATSASWCSASRWPPTWARPPRSTTSRTTSPCRPRCSWWWAWSSVAGGSTSLTKLGGLAKLTPAARGALLRPGDEPGRDPAAVRVPGQDRAARGRCPAGHAAGVRAGRRPPVADLAAHAVRAGEGVEQGVLAGPPEEPPPAGAPAFGMVAPTAALVAVGLLLTVAAGPLYAYTERAAVSLTERTPYVDAGAARRRARAGRVRRRGRRSPSR